MRQLVRLLSIAPLVALAVLVSGCGGGTKEGGTVTILNTDGGVDSLDPGQWYFQTDYSQLWQPTQRALYSWKASSTTPSPDLATGMPKVANGDKTITIQIRSGVKYSKPLANRSVQAADIQYAIERCFLPSVGNGYANAYYSDIAGAKAYASGKAKDISGLKAVNPTTLQITLDKPIGVLANANALALPCTTPVPKDYAQKYDKGSTSTYGQHQVFTGPYMIKGAGTGTVPKQGYQPQKLLDLVRNPSWSKKTDPLRAAHFNEIIAKCCSDSAVASRQILTGQSLMSGDFAAPPTEILKQIAPGGPRAGQAIINQSQGDRYIAFNTTIKPLGNVNFRRALVAATDRTTLRKTRGGPTIGKIATHWIPPQIPGFDEAGGDAGPGYDFYKSPTANIPLARSYLKKAGFPSGKYTGPPLLAVSDDSSPGKETGEAFQGEMAKIGLRLNLHEVPHQTMQSKYCLVPKAAVAICPSLAWGKDFFDAQSFFDPIFNGENIIPANNANVAQINDPAINKRIDAAKTITNAAQRTKAWGQLDRDLTGGAYYDVWLWDSQANFSSKNVAGVQSKFNSDWDLTTSALK